MGSGLHLRDSLKNKKRYHALVGSQFVSSSTSLIGLNLKARSNDVNVLAHVGVANQLGRRKEKNGRNKMKKKMKIKELPKRYQTPFHKRNLSNIFSTQFLGFVSTLSLYGI